MAAETAFAPTKPIKSSNAPPKLINDNFSIMTPRDASAKHDHLLHAILAVQDQTLEESMNETKRKETKMNPFNFTVDE